MAVSARPSLVAAAPAMPDGCARASGPPPAPAHGAKNRSVELRATRLWRSLLAPIPLPPPTNEHRQTAALGPLRYPRAALSSFAYNFAAVWISSSSGQHEYQSGVAAPLVLAALLHVMGATSLANWSARNELSRLLDLTCMIVLKCHFVGLALSLQGDDRLFLLWTGGTVLLAATLVIGLRLADGNRADLLMAPFLVALLGCEIWYRPPLLVDRPEGLLLFVAGYLCKLADVHALAPAWLWWTALFHASTAYVMALVGLGLTGALPRNHALLPRLWTAEASEALVPALGGFGVACCVVVLVSAVRAGAGSPRKPKQR